ncbi:FKBP-type peptidyl-prolyl cis-trans isomerase [bacterium]|nr:FKBP-type peptidyl-prolyl cis-trans isomerase [bacterium]
MKNVLIFTLLLFGALTIFAAEEKETETAPAEKQETTKQEVKPNMKDFSYSLGYEMYTNNKKYKLVLSPEKLIEGIDDGYANAAPKFKQDDVKAQHVAFMAHMQADGESDFKDEKGILSYFTGFQVGKNFTANGIDSLDKNEILAGIKDAEEGKEPRLDEAGRKASMAAMDEVVKAKAKAKAEAVKVESKKFLEENAKKEGVKVTESGPQYTVIKEGEGAKPKATDTVKVHYKGTLVDGKEFDSSYKRGEPISFPLNGVIKGWTEGLQLMPVGSTYRFFIPSDLGYGDRGAGADIPGGAALIFDVELIEINPEK